MSSVSPGGADLVPTTPDWPAWAGFMVTTHFDLVSGPFHSPIFIGLHSVSTSDNMYHLHSRAGELPRSASSHFRVGVSKNTNSDKLLLIDPNGLEEQKSTKAEFCLLKKVIFALVTSGRW